METVSIRDLRGKNLREHARKGKPVAITNRGALIGVIIPVASAWIEHLIDCNWSHVRQSISEGEQAMVAEGQMTTITDLVPGTDSPGCSVDEPGPDRPGRLTGPLVAALAGTTMAQAPETKEAIEQLQAILNPLPPGTEQERTSPASSVRTVRIGDLTATLIETAGAAGQTLAVTHDRQLLGIIVPVTRNLVEFLLEQNISRVLYNIMLGEKQISTRDQMITLEQAAEPGQADAAPGAPRDDAATSR